MQSDDPGERVHHLIDECEHQRLTNEEPLQFLRTVDRTLVHKQAIADVFLTDSRTLANDEYLVAAQWPRRHWHFGEPAVRLEPLLVAETLRQVCLYLAFAHLGIPKTAHLLIDEFTVTPLLQRLPSDSPTNVRIRVSVDCDGALRIPRRLFLRTVFRTRDCTIAFASGVARALPPEAFTRLRGRRSPAVERRESGGRRLRLDLSHPMYFDHPSDHVPGLMLVEHALRTPRTASLSGWHTERFSANFRDFVELDAPAGVRVVFDRRLDRRSHRTTVRIIQFGQSAAEITAQFRFRDGRGP